MKHLARSRMEFILGMLFIFALAVVCGLYYDRDPDSGKMRWARFVARLVYMPAVAVLLDRVFLRVRARWFAASSPAAPDALETHAEGQDD